MHESDSSPSNAASASEYDRIQLHNRLLGLSLLAVVGLIAYSGLIIAIVRVWTWIGAHFSSVEMLTVAAVIVLASQIYMRLRYLSRLSARKDLSLFILI
jgi:hypothetical protein